jgi:hypothetical protein
VTDVLVIGSESEVSATFVSDLFSQADIVTASKPVEGYEVIVLKCEDVNVRDFQSLDWRIHLIGACENKELIALGVSTNMLEGSSADVEKLVDSIIETINSDEDSEDDGK